MELWESLKEGVGVVKGLDERVMGEIGEDVGIREGVEGVMLVVKG